MAIWPSKYLSMRKGLMLCMSLTLVSIGVGANIAHAAPIPQAMQKGFAGLSSRAYGDAVCGPMLMSANLPWVVDTANQAGIIPVKPIFPRNSSCIITQSYVNLPSSTVISQEVLDHASASLDSAAPFETQTIQPLAAKNGENISVNRLKHTMATPFMGMDYEKGLAQLALFASEYGWDKAQTLSDVRVTLSANSTSTWNTRLATVASNATGTQVAERAMQSEDGSMWSFAYQGKVYLNGKLLTGSEPTGFILDTKNNHWAYVASSTVATDRGTYGPYVNALIGEPWLLADGSAMYVVQTSSASTTVQTMYRDGKPVAIADKIGSAVYQSKIADVVYTARTSAGWTVISGNVPSQTWVDVSLIRVDTINGGIAYVATSKDGKKNIIMNGVAHPIAWTPVDLEFNDGNHQPYAYDATGRFWTPTREWKYSMTPSLRAADSHGRILAFTTYLGEFVDMWADDTYIGRFRNIDPEKGPALSVKKEIDPYFPGYTMTYTNDVAFDTQDQLILYRQEGRVFTRTTYRIK